MEQSFIRPSLSGFFTDSRVESRFLIQMNNLETMIQYWKDKFEEEQNVNKNLTVELAEEKGKNQILTNELTKQSTNNNLDDEFTEEQTELQYLANELEKEKSNNMNVVYELFKEKSVSHRLRLERMVYMICFSFGAISILIYDFCSKLK